MTLQFEPAFQSLLADPQWSPAWLRPLRSAAFEDFKAQGLPSRQNEDWKYTSTRALAAGEFHLKASPGSLPDAALDAVAWADADRIVFIDGHFAEAASQIPAGVEVKLLASALQNESAGLRAALESSVDSLSRLNLACLSSGVSIKVSKDAVIKRPIQLLYIESSGPSNGFVTPFNFIQVERQAEVSFLETHVSQGQNFTNSRTEVQVGAGAQVRYVMERVLGETTQLVASHRFVLSRDARVETFNLAIGGALNRSQLEFQMSESGTFARLDGLYIARDGVLIDNVSEVKHMAPQTSSAQLYKGILDGKSRAVFNGKITIARHAQQTDAQQLNKTLLLSEDAEIDSRPQLQIDADDVRCSHGATIGQLDEQELFYLQSRAISREDAQKMLAKAFVGDVIGRIGAPDFVARLQAMLASFGGTIG